MHSVTGIFSTSADAARATDALRALQFPRDQIDVVTPGSDPTSVPTDSGEEPGLGRAIGGVTGGAAGMVKDLRASLEAHIQEEEGTIFPRISQVWDRRRLERAGAELEQMKAEKSRRAA